MSATNFTPIQLYRTSTAAAVPTAGNLADGELAINLTDEALYFKNAAGVVKLLADSSGALGTVTSVDVSGGTTGLTTSGGPITTSGTITLAGTLGVANGGTGTATAFTAGSVVFAGASGVYSQDNANLFWDNTNDRLGIGTATPGTKLDVQGAVPFIRVKENSTGYLGLRAENDSGNFYFGIDNSTGSFFGSAYARVVYADGAYPMAFYTNATERMRITAAGGLAVGTTTDPGAGNIGLAAGKFLQFSSTAYMTPEDNVAGARIVTPGAFNLATGGTAVRMTVDASGNVGIGYSTLYDKLQVAGSVSSQGGGYFGFYRNGPTNNTGTLDGVTIAQFGVSAGVATGRSDASTWLAGFDSLRLVTAGIERMRIDSGGNVGIGTSSPYNGRLTLIPATDPTTFSGANQLQVGESSSNSAYRMQVGYLNHPTAGFIGSLQAYGGSVPANLSINGDGGNVGIGTASPTSRLTISSGQFTSPALNIIGAGPNQGWLRLGNNADIKGGDDLLGMTFTVGAAERMRIDSSGNVGIGTTLPQAPFGGRALQVGTTTDARAVFTLQSTTTGLGSIYFSDGTTGGDTFVGYIDYDHSINAMNFGTGATQRMRIDSSGQVGIGTTAPISGYQLTMEGVGAYAALRCVSASGFSTLAGFDGATQRWAIGQAGFGGVNGLGFYVGSGTEVGRFDASGNLLVGTTTADGRVSIYTSNNTVPALTTRGAAGDLGTAAAWFVKNDNNTTSSQIFVQFFIANGGAGSGAIVANGASQAAFASFSDARLKENIADLPSQLDNILALRPVEFDYIESEGGGHQIGFVAQEIEQVFPEAVSEREDGMKTVVGWTKTEAILVKAIQELTARVAQLEGN